MKISEKILILRKKKGLSQENLANMLNLSRQAVFKWEAGESVPDLDNIKKLAEIFEVSFDYLLNDKIEKTDEEKKENNDSTSNEPIKYRRAFSSKESMLSCDHSDVDKGYFKERKIKYDKNIYFDKEIKIANDAQSKYGFQRYIQIIDDCLITFFDDSNKKVFGFMCNESIQLYVPYENLIDVQLEDNGTRQKIKRTYTPGVAVGSIFGVGISSDPIVLNEKAKIYSMTISFFDEGGNIQSKKFGFSVFTFADGLIEKIKDVETIEQMRRMQIMANLNKIKTLLVGIKEIGNQIREKRINVVDDVIEFDFDKQINDWKKRREESLNQAKQDYILEKKKARRKKLIEFGIIAVLFIIFFIWAVKKCS